MQKIKIDTMARSNRRAREGFSREATRREGCVRDVTRELLQDGSLLHEGERMWRSRRERGKFSSSPLRTRAGEKKEEREGGRSSHCDINFLCRARERETRFPPPLYMHKRSQGRGGTRRVREGNSSFPICTHVHLGERTKKT